MEENRKTLWSVSLILVLGMTIAVAVNIVHPHSVSWVQDWSNYIETKAWAAGVTVIPVSVARSYNEDKSHLFVDARSIEEFNVGHIPSARSLSFEDLDNNFDVLEELLDSSEPLVIYCSNRECDDALLLAIELQAMGQSNLVYFVDGFEWWEESGCPIETL